MRFILVALSLVAAASAHVEVTQDYHRDVGIPLATRIKEAEDAILAGNSDVQLPKIVGGSEAPSHSYPFLGGLVITFQNMQGVSACGSSLITANRLVTAAHCWVTHTFQAREFVVVLGSQFLFSGGTRIATSQVVVHPQWDSPNLRNDVAVIYLPINVLFSERIHSVALPHNELWDSFVGEMATAAGYGKTSDSQVGVSVSSVVSHVNVRVITVQQCQAVFGWFAQPSNICTNGAGGIGICGGDSGGPLVVNRNGQPVLVGISSFVASAGCQLGHPSAFARVTSFYDFIMQNL